MKKIMDAEIFCTCGATLDVVNYKHEGGTERSRMEISPVDPLPDCPMPVTLTFEPLTTKKERGK
jgi:hypothetical protein